MTIDFNTYGIVEVSMVYVKDTVAAWDKASDEVESDGFKVNYRKLSGQATPAPSNLFTIDEVHRSRQKSRKRPSTM